MIAGMLLNPSPPGRLIALVVATVLSIATPLAADEKISGVIEAVTPAGLVVDSSTVALEEGGRLRGDVKSLPAARVGWWLEAKGRRRRGGDLLASSIRIEKEAPGVSYAERLREQSRKESGKLNASDKIFHDEEVTRYVSDLGMSLVPEYAAGMYDFSFHVIEDPSLNAFAFPNGAIYVHTGLLAKLDNEAQLAIVLGHEISHVTQRHGQRQYKSMMSWAIPAQIGAIVVGVQVNRRTDNPVFAAMAGLGVSLGLSAAVNGYGRKLEDQADRVGLRYMAGDGYDPREAPRVWDTFTDVYGDESRMENFFWSNHSTNDVRKSNLREEIRIHYGKESGGGEGAPADAGPSTPPAKRKIRTLEYQNVMLGVTRSNAIQDFEIERYTLAEKGFDRVLRRRPGDSVSWHYKGRIYLETIEDEEDARSRALAAYLKSISLDAGYADVHRDLGLLYAEMERGADARSHLQQYLNLAPGDAGDRKEVEKAIRKIS
jgi:predicted Zn-dependent protease